MPPALLKTPVKILPPLLWAWIATGIIAAIDGAGILVGHFSIPADSLTASGISIGLMLVLSAVYSWLRPDERLAHLTGVAAVLITYSICLGILSYLAAACGAPLIDDQLAALDRAAGFDWMAVYHWVEAHKILRGILIAAYDSVIPQLGLLIMIMVSLRRYERALLLLWLYIICGTVYVAISALLPAIGAYGYYGVALDTPYVQQFTAIRSSGMQVLDFFQMQGIVQFPSFHLALAVMCAYAVRGMRVLFPCLLVLNVLVILATPAIGGHFLSDLWSSALLMPLLIFAVTRVLKKAG